MSNSEMVLRTEADDYKPVMSIDDMIAQRAELNRYVNACLVQDTPGKVDGDYGTIPGAGDRKVLHLPGAQKLCRMRGLSPDYEILSEDEDWTGEKHGGEPFFNYKIKCILYREDRRMGSGVGACNSFEKKYRYVNSQRVCPGCGQPFIFAQKSDRGGGFFCWQSKGGCGRQFKPGTPECNALQAQDAGKTANPDAADLQNTILKMAKKRAYIDATLSVVGASEFFTQDVETEHKPPVPTITKAEYAVNGTPQRQPPQCHNEQVYEAEYVPERGYDDRYGPVKRKGDVAPNYAPNHPPLDTDIPDSDTRNQPAPTINKAQASAQLKQILDEGGYAPPSIDEYKRIMKFLLPDKEPESWKTQDYLDAAALPLDRIATTIKQMYIPEAAGKPNDAVIDAATMYQSPAQQIKESLNNVA